MVIHVHPQPVNSYIQRLHVGGCLQFTLNPGNELIVQDKATGIHDQPIGGIGAGSDRTDKSCKEVKAIDMCACTCEVEG